LDLPQLYTRPSSDDLLHALRLLAVRPRDFACSTPDGAKHGTEIDGDGDDVSGRSSLSSLPSTDVTRYLTSIVSSPLAWLASDSDREAVWDAASARLCERSGRTGMTEITRTFAIPVRRASAATERGDVRGDDEEVVELALREPAMTADNLGNKTWVSSFLLARRLVDIILPPPPAPAPAPDSTPQRVRALELGAGTGLVGLAFAALWGNAAASVHLTDLDAIVPNIRHNVEMNAAVLASRGAGEVTADVLDWSVTAATDEEEGITTNESDSESPRQPFDIILVADPLYSPDHPRWLVQTIARWLARHPRARVVAEMPLRTPYLPQVADFRRRMAAIGLAVLREGEETGHDDWEGRDGRPLEANVRNALAKEFELQCQAAQPANDAATDDPHRRPAWMADWAEPESWQAKEIACFCKRAESLPALPKLRGSENYDEWEATLLRRASLLGCKQFLQPDHPREDKSSPAFAVWQWTDSWLYCYMFSSLAPQVIEIVPPTEAYEAYPLFSLLKKTYGDSNDTKARSLFAALFNAVMTALRKGEDLDPEDDRSYIRDLRRYKAGLDGLEIAMPDPFYYYCLRIGTSGESQRFLHERMGDSVYVGGTDRPDTNVVKVFDDLVFHLQGLPARKPTQQLIAAREHEHEEAQAAPEPEANGEYQQADGQ
ncbi:hypothetical protein KEM52_000386, partial [Ascosphaera acerosa]